VKHVLVEMEESVQKTETELSPVLVQLFTKASCVNKEVRYSNIYFITHLMARLYIVAPKSP
jgi:hypothetical protein